jgi:5-methylcytosine-specific restriction protein A
MPKTRQPREVWYQTRKRIWRRDRGQCLRCLQLGIAHVWPLQRCHIDHIQSGKRSSNADSNLRTLCRMHHTLRLDMRHRSMIGGALRAGLIPVNWREHLW